MFNPASFTLDSVLANQYYRIIELTNQSLLSINLVWYKLVKQSVWKQYMLIFWYNSSLWAITFKRQGTITQTTLLHHATNIHWPKQYQTQHFTTGQNIAKNEMEENYRSKKIFVFWTHDKVPRMYTCHESPERSRRSNKTTKRKALITWLGSRKSLPRAEMGLNGKKPRNLHVTETCGWVWWRELSLGGRRSL